MEADSWWLLNLVKHRAKETDTFPNQSLMESKPEKMESELVGVQK